ncbi:hypothetical protein Tco_0427448 [Tanacetum coccineum]
MSSASSGGYYNFLYTDYCVRQSLLRRQLCGRYLDGGPPRSHSIRIRWDSLYSPVAHHHGLLTSTRGEHSSPIPQDRQMSISEEDPTLSLALAQDDREPRMSGISMRRGAQAGYDDDDDALIGDDAEEGSSLLGARPHCTFTTTPLYHHITPIHLGVQPEIQDVRIASTQALVDVVTAALPSPPLLPLPPSIYIPPPVDRKDDIPEFERPPRKRSCLFALDFSTLDAEERRRTFRRLAMIFLSEVGYGTWDTWETVLIVEEEAYASREAWAHSIRLSQAVHHELQTHRDHVYATRVSDPCSSDTAIVIGYSSSDTTPGQQRARQPGPDARIPDDQDASRDADSHI